jgi:hypothetical protein
MDMLHKYLKSLGMIISWEKSQTFQVVAKGDTWFRKEPEIMIEDNPIPPVDPEEALFIYMRRQVFGHPLWHSCAGDAERGEKSKTALFDTMSEDQAYYQLSLPLFYLQSIDQSTK